MAWFRIGSDGGGAPAAIEAPGFTVVCVLTLALGIGGNTAVFTLIDRVLLKPLPVPRPSELYRVGDTDACCVNSGCRAPSRCSRTTSTPAARRGAGVHAPRGVPGQHASVTIGRPDDDAPPETLNGAFVSGNYFQLFELVPAAGRLIQPADDRRGAAPVAVLSYRGVERALPGARRRPRRAR